MAPPEQPHVIYSVAARVIINGRVGHIERVITPEMIDNPTALRDAFLNLDQAVIDELNKNQ